MRETERQKVTERKRDWPGPVAILFLPFLSQILLWSLKHVYMLANLIQL